jgi:hypothetical protein
MINICAREATLGHVTMWVLIIVLIRVVFHGPHDRRLSMQASFTRGKLPLTAATAPVTLKISLCLSHQIEHRDI